MIGLESCLGVVKKVLVDDEDLGLLDMIKLLTVSPRKIMGFDYDLLKEGKEAELVLFNEMKNGFLIKMILIQNQIILHLLMLNCQEK